jgi:ATP-dependent helicase/nuclease subunit B
LWGPGAVFFKKSPWLPEAKEEKMGFLEKIAAQFLEQYGNDLHRIVFVFPTRRARLYFLRFLQLRKRSGSSIWAPPVFSNNDFIAKLSGLAVLEPLELIFRLYAVYREHAGNYPREFEAFYPWGKMIIADFDEIDKYLIDPGELFRNLEEFKIVEDLTKEEKSAIYNRYTGFWEELGIIYREFNRLLRGQNRAYEGMVYREVAERIKSGQGLAELPGERVIFCGFNAFTRAEEVMVSHLLDTGQGEIYWDMDRYFVEDRNQEAGHFFRKNRDIFHLNQPQWVEDRLAEPKHIEILGVQSRVSQAKVLGLKLMGLRDYLTDPASAAVVLPDETLLFPVLNSLPEVVEQVNITIGFPLRQTPVFSLCDSFMEMQQRAVETGQGFYYKDVRDLLNHPYIKPLAHEQIEAAMTKIKKENRIYIKAGELRKVREFIFPVEVLNRLFEERRDSGQVLDFFLELLDAVREFYRENKPDLFSVDYEYMYHFYTLVSQLKDSLRNAGLVLGLRGFRQLFTDIVQHTRTPFTGEPLMGLQVMGMLETQTLDFNHLMILSVNEGHLPPGKVQQSFIPFDVRTALGLPTYKERDAIAAYHFYRLLKSSKNITLIYITESKGIEKSEKSRFIDQVLIEYAERNKNARISQQILDFSFETQAVKEISVQKSGRILEKLAKKSYSSSSLLTYLTCSLKFYFTYILELWEEEEMVESPDYRLVGEIIHETLHQLYQPFCGKDRLVTSKEIEGIKAQVEGTLGKVFLAKLQAGDLQTGRNRIAYEVMKRFLDNFFEKEKQASGFKVLMLEKKIENVDFGFTLEGKEQQVKLGGTVDRLDVKDGVFRVIDYKTGRIGSLNLKSAEEFSEQLSGQEAVNRKEVFQLFFYRYLLKQSGHNHGEYRLGIYPFKKMYDELKFVRVDKSEAVADGLVERFAEVLGDLFRELFSQEVPFKQTEEEKNCQYCPYQGICNRETGQYYPG